jgi:hypothetical protein
VAPTALRRAVWIGGAAAAIALLVALASHGRRADPGLARFEPAGIMVTTPPERVVEVVVSSGERHRRFTKDATGTWNALSGAPASVEASARLERGLRFLHVSAPERAMGREELAGTSLAELGLDPPRFSVSIRSATGEPFAVAFGALNPQGLAQYARVEGRDEVLLLPSFAGEPWAALVDGR